MTTNNQSKELEERLKILESDIRKSEAHLPQWISIGLSFAVGFASLFASLYIGGRSLSISDTLLKLSLIEKKPNFSYLIRYNKPEGKCFMYIKNETKNKARLLSVHLLPKIYNRKKMAVRDGKPISVLITDKTFTKGTDDQRPIENFYKANNIEKDSEEVWIEGTIRYYNMETKEWGSQTISHIDIKEE